MGVLASSGGLVVQNEAVCIVGGLVIQNGLLTLSGGLVMQNEVFCIIWGLCCVKWGCWCCLRAWLCVMRQFAQFEGLVMRNVGVGIVWGFSYTKWGSFCLLAYLMGLPHHGSPPLFPTCPQPICSLSTSLLPWIHAVLIHHSPSFPPTTTLSPLPTSPLSSIPLSFPCCQTFNLANYVVPFQCVHDRWVLAQI